MAMRSWAAALRHVRCHDGVLPIAEAPGILSSDKSLLGLALWH